jgi:hypothetical protein
MSFEKDIYKKFVKYYFDKYNDPERALCRLQELRIEELYYIGSNKVVIILGCPGKFIGARGQELENLKKVTECEFIIVESRPTIYDKFSIILSNLAFEGGLEI